MRDLHYRIGLLIAQQDSFLYNKYDSFILFSLLQRHKISCIDKYCFCKRKTILKSIQDTRMTINSDFMRRYILKLVHRMGDYFKNCKFTSQEVIYFVHYVYLLNDFDQSTLALAQLNQMIYQNRNTTKFGMYQKTILAILNQHIKQRMTQNNQVSKNEKVSIFTQIVESFLTSEQKSKDIKQDIIKLLDSKIKLYDHIIQGKFETAQQIYDSSTVITNTMLNTQELLEELYFNYPSSNQRSIMSFFQAEIHNNFYKADYFQNLTVHNKVSELYQKSPIDFFSQDIVYLVVAYGKERGKIKNYSPRAASFFGYDKERFDFVLSIEDLIPPGISTVHDAFVNNFFQTGQSGYFRNLGTSIAKLDSGFILPIELLFDINFLVQDEFTFVVFIRKLLSKNVFLIIDEQGRIGGISQNFFSQVGAPPDIHNDILIKLSQSLNINNLIPSFWDLMNQMKEQEVLEAKHFDITLKFLRDMNQFVSKNSDVLRKNEVSDLNLRASVASKKKRIRKSEKEINSPSNVNMATINKMRRSTHFQNNFEQTKHNISHTSHSQKTPNSTPQINPFSDISDRSLQSHLTLNSRRTVKSSKSFVSRKTLGWKKNKMAKFQTNIIIRARNFTTDDGSLSFKYFIVELEDLKKPSSNDWDKSQSGSYQSQNTASRSFMTMKTGKSLNTLVSGSFQMSNHSLDDEKDRSLQIDNEDHHYDNQDSIADYNSNRLNKYNTGLEPIEEEQKNLKKKKTLGESQHQYSTHSASIFSGKKQLGWVTRIVNQQQQKKEQQEKENKLKSQKSQFITQNNTNNTDYSEESRDVKRTKTEKKLHNRTQTPLDKNKIEDEEDDDYSEDYVDGQDEDDENTSQNSKTSGSKKTSKSGRSGKSSKSSKKSAKSVDKEQNKQFGEKQPTIFVNNQEETASFSKGQTMNTNNEQFESKAFFNAKNIQTIIHKEQDQKQPQNNSLNRLESDKEKSRNNVFTRTESDKEKNTAKQYNTSNSLQKAESKNKISFINIELFQHSDSKKDQVSNTFSIIQQEKQADGLHNIDVFNHENYFDDNILDQSNKNSLFNKDQTYMQSNNDHSNLLQSFDRSFTKSPDDSADKKISIMKIAQSQMNQISNLQLINEEISQNKLSTGTSNNQIPQSIYSVYELDQTMNQQKGPLYLSKNVSSNLSNNVEIQPLRDDIPQVIDRNEDLNEYDQPASFRYQQKFYNNEVGGVDSDIVSYSVNNKGSQNKQGSNLQEKLLYRTDEQFIEMIQKCFQKVKIETKRNQKGINQGQQVNRSTENIRASKQYFVYEQLNSFLTSQKIPSSIKHGLSFWLIGLLIFLAFCLSLLFSVRNKFQYFESNLSLINIQNELLLPIDYVTAFSLLHKQDMLKNFTPSNPNDLLVQSILLESFQYFFETFKQTVDGRLQDDMTIEKWLDEELIVKMRSSSMYKEQTLPLLQTLNMIINNMLEIYQEFQLTGGNSKSNYFDSFFQFINYGPIINFFDNFSNEVIDANTQLTSDTETLLTEISLPMILGSVLIYLASFYYLLKYKQLQESIMKFFYHTDKISLSRDIERHKILKALLTQGEDQLYQYNFSITHHDAFLEAEDEFHEQMITEMKQYKARLPEFNLKQSKIFYLFFVVFISYILFIAGSFTYLKIFISNYHDLISSLQDFSKISYRASNLLAERELCYANFSLKLIKDYPPISEIDYQEVSDIFKKDIESLGSFIDSIGKLSFSLVDKSITDEISNLLKNDICGSIRYESEYFKKDKSSYDNACYYVQSGVLEQGIITSLNQLKNKFNSEFKETLFQNRQLYNDPEKILDESLALILISSKISTFTLQIIENINVNKEEVNANLTIIICISMGVLGIINFVLFIYGRNHLLNVYAHNKLIIFLLPQQTIIMQNKLFNQFKTFLKTYDL